MEGLLKQDAEQPEEAVQPDTGAQGGEPEFSSPEVEGLYVQAVDILYDKKYKEMVKMFKANGEEGFPRSISTSINTVIGQLEKQGQPIPPENAAEIGMKLFYDLLEDVVSGELLPKLSMETIQEGLNQTLTMYAQSHKDTVSDDDMAQLAQQLDQGNQQAPGQQPEQPVNMPQGGQNGIA